MRLVRTYGIYFAWLVSLIATLGSLYFSEILGFIPCTLCWVQRILMYPLVILLGIASYRNDRGIIPYVLPITVLGAGISLFHYLKQKVPALSEVAACKVGVPCEQMYINWFGFVTIPFLALVAFLLIIGFLWAARKHFE
jgi:disulfide bond formation protein DsbB